MLGDLAAAMPQAVTVTPEEREAIERVSIISCFQPGLITKKRNKMEKI